MMKDNQNELNGHMIESIANEDNNHFDNNLQYTIKIEEIQISIQSYC